MLIHSTLLIIFGTTRYHDCLKFPKITSEQKPKERNIISFYAINEYSLELFRSPSKGGLRFLSLGNVNKELWELRIFH
jgi:hypothetical protein